MVVMVCPKCGEYGTIEWPKYLMGLRPLCEYCGKTRMIKAPDDTEKKDA